MKAKRSKVVRTPEEEAELQVLLEQHAKDKLENKILSYYPDTGPLRRSLYSKHMEFFVAGAKHKVMTSCPKECNGAPHDERCLCGGNRVGKSELGAFETVCHLTGEYPPWWKGKRFTAPISAWAAGDISQTTRDIIQNKILGPFGSYGTGMLPRRCLIHTTTKGGLPGAVETAYVRHISGGRSDLGFKSYDQGRLAFQGTSKNWIWLDEEPKREIYVECVLRTMRTATFEGGQIILTFTPLFGMSEVVRDFLGISDLSDGSAILPEAPAMTQSKLSDELED